MLPELDRDTPRVRIWCWDRESKPGHHGQSSLLRRGIRLADASSDAVRLVHGPAVICGGAGVIAEMNSPVTYTLNTPEPALGYSGGWRSHPPAQPGDDVDGEPFEVSPTVVARPEDDELTNAGRDEEVNHLLERAG